MSRSTPGRWRSRTLMAAAAALVCACLSAPRADAGIRRVWAVNDGVKVDRDARDHPARTGNSAWDGRRVRVFGARNEVLAFQLVVEADEAGVSRLQVSLPRLNGPDGAALVYKAPASDPTEYVDRPIQLFVVHYMHVAMPSHASWVFARGSAAAPTEPLGWKPVQLVPEHATRSGLPITVGAGQTQAIWFEIYTGRGRPAGMYTGAIEVVADGVRHAVPIDLELLDFDIPDRNSMHAMLHYESSQPERYHGRHLDPAYHRLAHRHRVELVHAYDESSLSRVRGRFTGEDFTRAHGYDGPGAGVGNVLAPRTFYGPGPFEHKDTAWAASDAWMTFLRATVPGAITFLYLPDEPTPPAYPRILRIAEIMRSNPGPGRALPLLVTSRYVKALEGAVDIWDSGPKGFVLEDVARERAQGRKYWFYNGGRPAAGAIVIDSPATDARASIWAAFKHDVEVYFYWHAVHWRHNGQKRVGDRDQNVWADSITFDNRAQPDKPIDDQGYIHGDGVLLYPGQERLHPTEDRGVPGPVSTVQLANFRRGLQDHQYLTLARALGLTDDVNAVLQAIVPRVFSDAGETVSFPETGDPYEAARLRLARAIVAAQTSRR
jgi:hypothetical protein